MSTVVAAEVEAAAGVEEGRENDVALDAGAVVVDVAVGGCTRETVHWWWPEGVPDTATHKYQIFGTHTRCDQFADVGQKS